MNTKFNRAISIIKQKIEYFGIYNSLFLIVYFILLYAIASNQFVWLDEGCSLKTTSNGVLQALKYSFSFERQPPLYFVLLGVWRSFNDSIIFARVFSILFIALSVVPINRLLVQFFGKEARILIWLFLLNPFTVYAALEIRYISLMIFVVAWLELLFLNVYINGNTKSRPFFICFSVIGIYTQYFTCFLLFINFLVLLINNRKLAYKYLYDMIIPVLSLVAFIPVLTGQVVSNTVDNTSFSFNYFLNFVMSRVKGLILSTHKLESFSLMFELVFTGIILIAVISNKPFILLKKLFKDYLLQKIVLLLLTFIILIIPVNKIIIQPRHLIILFIPIVIVLFKVLFNTNPILRRYVISALILIYIVISSVKYVENVRGKEYYNIGNYIELNEGTNQPIFVYRNDLSILLPLYYSGNNKIVQVPGKINFKVPQELDRKAIKNKTELAGIFSEHDRGDTLWFVTTKNSGLYGVDFKNELVEEFVEENYITLKENSFNEIKVRKLLKKN